MATRRRHRPSALREISKNLINDDDNSDEEMSASISPTNWVQQVQQSHAATRMSSINPPDGSNQFHFRTERVIREVVQENEESELESDYTEVSETEEEEVITQVPVEKLVDVYETESASAYTSDSPSHSISPHYNVNDQGVVSSKPSQKNRVNAQHHNKPNGKPRNRRQSVPILGPRRGGQSTHQVLSQHDSHRGNLRNLHHHRRQSVESESSEFRSPNAENRPPATPTMNGVTEENKDRELDSSNVHQGSFNGSGLEHSLILDHIEENESNHNGKKKPKMSILPPTALEFDTLISPAPPSILNKRKQSESRAVEDGNGKGKESARKRRITSNSQLLSPLAPTRAPHDTPNFSNIHQQMESVLRFGQKFGGRKDHHEVSTDTNDNRVSAGVDAKDVDGAGMSVDGSPNEDEDDGVSPIGDQRDQREQSQASSLARIHAVTEIGKTTGDICSGLENTFKGLRATFPSPAMNSKANKVNEDEDGDHNMEQHSEPEVEDQEQPDDDQRARKSRSKNRNQSSDNNRSRSRSRSKAKSKERGRKQTADEDEVDGGLREDDTRSPSPSNSPPKRRRSARIAKKRKSAISQSEDEEIDLSNIDTRSRRGKSKSKKGSRSRSKTKSKPKSNAKSKSRSRSRSRSNSRSKKKSKQTQDEEEDESRYERTNETVQGLPPFIEDSGDDDAVLLDDPPLPATKKKRKTTESRTRGGNGRTAGNGRDGRNGSDANKDSKDRTPSPRESDHDDEGEENFGATEHGVLSTVRKRTTRHSIASAQSNRSMISNISGISGVSSIASNRSRTKTLRSRKNDDITSPFSDHDDPEEEDLGTFDTPKSDRTRNRRSRSGGKRKRNAVTAQNRKGGKSSKSPLAKRQSNRSKNNQNKNRNRSKSRNQSTISDDNESAVDLQHNDHSNDIDDIVEDVDHYDNANGMEMDHGDNGFDDLSHREFYDDTNMTMNDDTNHNVAVPFDSPNPNEVEEEKLEIESRRSDDEYDDTPNEPSPSTTTSKAKRKNISNRTSKSNPTRSRAKSKSTKTSKKKKGRNQKKAKTEKQSKDKKNEKKKRTKKSKSKSRRNRKRKASDTDLSESPEPERKRPRLSQVVVKPSSVPPPDNLRRSKRVKFKPLAFWANERIAPTNDMLTYDAVKECFDNDEADKIILGQQDELTNFGVRQQKKSKRKRSSKRNASKSKKEKTKGKSKRKKKRKRKDEEESSVEPMTDEDDEEVDAKPFDGTAWIYDSVNDNMIQKCVAKTKKCVNLVELSFGQNEEDENHNGGPKTNKSKSKVRGAKGLEEESFSCGILEIPPSSEKHPEISFFTEQFFVHKCEAKKLQFKLGDDEFLLSRGSMFFVPPENEYSLHNLSKTHPVQLIFTLIKQKEREDEETMNQTQMSQSQMEMTGSQEY